MDENNEKKIGFKESFKNSLSKQAGETAAGAVVTAAFLGAVGLGIYAWNKISSKREEKKAKKEEHPVQKPITVVNPNPIPKEIDNSEEE